MTDVFFKVSGHDSTVEMMVEKMGRLTEAAFWDANARGRAKWESKFDESFGPMSARLVELAGVAEGHRILDVGTGAGEPALTAARIAGSLGGVVGTDFSPAMLKLAARRAADQGLGLDLRVMDASSLHFPEASFDAVLCQLVLMFLADSGSVLRSIRSLLRPGGRLAAAVLGPPPKTPSVMIWQAALSREREFSGAALESKRPVAADSVNPFSFARPGALAAAFAEAGFADVHTEQLTTAHRFASADEFVEFQLDMDPAVKSQLSIMGAARVLDSVRELLEPFTDTGGKVHLTHVHNLAVGAVPA